MKVSVKGISRVLEAIGIMAIILMCLTACVSSTNTAQPQNSATQGEAQVTMNPTGIVDAIDTAQASTPEPSPTVQPTATPEPSPTERPRFDINDPATWPQEMQDYFNRAPEEWNNPTRQYVSNEVFDQFIQQARRDFLSELGIDGVAGMNDQDTFTEYVRWGMENRQKLTLSPLEKINKSNGPYALYRGDLVVGQGTPQGIAQNQDLGRPSTSDDLELFQQLAQMNTRVFGEEIRYSRMGNDNMIGTLIGVVRPTGTRAEQAADCLMYYEQEGQGYWAIVAVSFSPETHLAGEQFIYLDGGYKTTTYSNNHEARALINGATREPVTEQILVDHLDTNIWLKMGGKGSILTPVGTVRMNIELTAAGLEKAIDVIFDIPQHSSPILPWD